MFAKIFNQIYDSSIVECPETRFTFMDLLVLSDRNGVVDMTHEAISRRTNRPLDVIRKTIAELEGADPRSRTPDMNGARIYRLDDHRDWGWGIVNYDYFRKLASEEQRREKTRLRVAKLRKKQDVTHSNAVKRIGNDSPSPSLSPSSFLEELKRNLFYAGIDIDRELENAQKWCARKNRRCTRRFFENWLSKADRLVVVPPSKPKPVSESPKAPMASEEQRKEVAEKMRGLREQFRMP